jgi:hypothetical protein
MASLFQSLRWVHIAAGSIALILFWIPAIARKGGRTHIRAGWIYVVCMSIVVVTAFAMSGLAFTVPLAIRRIARPLSPAELSARKTAKTRCCRRKWTALERVGFVMKDGVVYRDELARQP